MSEWDGTVLCSRIAGPAAQESVMRTPIHPEVGLRIRTLVDTFCLLWGSAICGGLCGEGLRTAANTCKIDDTYKYIFQT